MIKKELSYILIHIHMPCLIELGFYSDIVFSLKFVIIKERFGWWGGRIVDPKGFDFDDSETSTLYIT